MRKLVLGIALITGLAACAVQQDKPIAKSPIDYVDPFIGTAGKGKTYPGATAPYGMVQLSPDNGRNGWDWISGYFHPDNVIAGFSHTHLSGTGAGDLYDISFMPYSGTAKYQQLDDINPNPTLVSAFSHQHEAAKPGYYRVYLNDYKINVELTAGLRVGLQRYRYQDASASAYIRLDLGYTRNWDKVTDSYIEVVDAYTLRGYRKSTGWAADQRVYFYTRLSHPMAQATLYDGTNVVHQQAIGQSAQGKGINSLLHFYQQHREAVVVATAISSVSMANAQLNFESELPRKINDKTFEQQLAKVQQDWQSELSKVEVKASEDNKVQFYTALYHTALAPRIFSDVNGQYKGPDGKIHQHGTTPRYEFFSLWDTFRALHPWKTITHPQQTQEMMQSLISHYQVYGLLPVWNFQGNETDMMMGYHAVPVLADAYLKGYLDIDGKQLLTMMTKSAEQQAFGIGDYQTKGYVPFETINWNVSRTLEYAFDDYAIAKVAEALGQHDIAEKYFKRGQNYRHHFDQRSRFMRAKSRNGDFKETFDPLAYHPEDYCEANAWQYNFFVPHDVPGLISLYPSQADFINHLDKMFTTQQAQDELPEWISGFIGQYVHGNEPAHHVPYLYRLAGQSHKGEKIIRRVMDEFYTTKADGLCGNEDAGQMSAWYLFSALGFYPVNPVSGEYVFGSPEVEYAKITLDNGNSFEVIVQNQSEDNVYVEQIWLNQQPLNSNHISHQQIMQGGQLRFVMTNIPN